MLLNEIAKTLNGVYDNIHVIFHSDLERIDVFDSPEKILKRFGKESVFWAKKDGRTLLAELEVIQKTGFTKRIQIFFSDLRRSIYQFFKVEQKSNFHRF